jgi:hypothetical protein
MTTLASSIVALLGAGALAAGGIAAEGSGPAAPRTAVVVDAAAARDGRELVDERLRTLDAAVRLPRTQAEAETNVRLFASQGYRVVVAGGLARRAARAADVAVVAAPDLDGVVAAAPS